MSIKLDMSGLDGLAKQVRSWGEELRREAETVMRRHALDHAAHVEAAFPANDRTGTLRRGHTGVEELGPMAYRVRNVAPHARLQESGWTQRDGVWHDGQHVMIPSAIRTREAMRREVAELPSRTARKVGLG